MLLSGDLELVVMPLPAEANASYRQLMSSEWYVLLGPTRSEAGGGIPQVYTGVGGYIGTSGGLCRAWASLRKWTTGCRWRLQPQVVVLGA